MKNRKSFYRKFVSLVLLAMLLLSSTACSAYWGEATPERIAQLHEMLDSYGSADNYIMFYTNGIAFGEDGRFVSHGVRKYEGKRRFEILRYSENGVYERAYFGEETDESFKILFYDYETFTPTVLFEAAMPEGGLTVISHPDGNFYVRADNGERGGANEDWYYLCDMETGTLRRLSEEEEPPLRTYNAVGEHGDGTYYAWGEGTSSYGDIFSLFLASRDYECATCIYVRDERTGEVKVIDEELLKTCPEVQALRDKGVDIHSLIYPYVKDGKIYMICPAHFNALYSGGAIMILCYDFESETLEYYAHDYILYDPDGYKGEARYLVIP